ncbi:hypothetical protein GMSM_13800 [Geomonas sp. Red276]
MAQRLFDRVIASSNAFFGRRSKNSNLLFGLTIAMAVGTLDLTTPPQYLFLFLYLFPICFTTWFAGPRRAGLVILACIYFFSATQLEFTHDYYATVWNMVSTLATFWVVMSIVSWIYKNWTADARMSRIDPLTGVFNHRGVLELMEYEVPALQRSNTPFTVAYLDIDHFKTVNDTLGHRAGDRLLQSVTSCLKMQLRKSDVIGRLGGDEFVIFLPGTDQLSAQVVIRKVQAALAAMFRADDLPVSVSVGAVSCAGAGGSLDDIISQADGLMYRVKNSGKNDVQFADYRAGCC